MNWKVSLPLESQRHRERNPEGLYREHWSGNQEKMRTFGAFLLGLTIASMSHAQENIVSVELLGRAAIYSVNYEHYFSRRFGAGAGIAIWGWGSGEFTYIVPAYLSVNPIGDKHSLYLGAGATVVRSNFTLFTSTRPYSTTVIGSASAGYQYRKGGGMIIRPATHLFFDRNSFVVWPGIAIGRSF